MHAARPACLQLLPLLLRFAAACGAADGARRMRLSREARRRSAWIAAPRADQRVAPAAAAERRPCGAHRGSVDGRRGRRHVRAGGPDQASAPGGADLQWHGGRRRRPARAAQSGWKPAGRPLSARQLGAASGGDRPDVVVRERICLSYAMLGTVGPKRVDPVAGRRSQRGLAAAVGAHTPAARDAVAPRVGLAKAIVLASRRESGWIDEECRSSGRELTRHRRRSPSSRADPVTTAISDLVRRERRLPLRVGVAVSGVGSRPQSGSM